MITLPDGGRRMIERHSLLKKLPKSWSKKLVSRLRPGFTGTIREKDTMEELGYMMDVPGFSADWGSLSFFRREKQLKALIDRLRDAGIHILVFPYWNCYLEREEIDYIEANELIVLDGYKIRTYTLIQVLDHFCRMLKSYLPSMKLGVWRADNDAGEIWAAILAKRFNEVTLGGMEREELNRIADSLMYSTGLSCRMTDNMDECIANKDMVIVTSDIEANKITRGSIVFNAHRLEFFRREKPLLVIDSGWTGIPHDIMVDRDLRPWEEIALLEGIFCCMSENYRKIAMMPEVTEDHLDHIQNLFKLYPLKIKGIVAGERDISFDAFRMSFLDPFIKRIKRNQGAWKDENEINFLDKPIRNTL